jgi:serine/threonine protein kinase
VAIKLSRATGTSGRRADARLLREARMMAGLHHPNLVTLHDLGEHEGRTYLTMELVRGATLRDHIGRAGGGGWRTQLPIVLAAARGLAALHAAGITHRDVKPENILIGEDGRVALIDLGLAFRNAPPAAPPIALPRTRTVELGPDQDDDGAPRAAMAEEAGPSSEPLAGFSTTHSCFGGTQGYVAPERVAGALGDPRTDVFALCVSAYELLEGRHPFRFHGCGELSHTTHYEKLCAPPRPWRLWNIPMRLRAAVERGLAADPDRRWQDAAELVAELEALAAAAR